MNRKRRVLSFLLERQRFLCGICHRRLNLREATIDHIIPLSLGGANREENFAAVHYQCNQEKGDRIL